MSDDGYEVGYKRPPKDRQFQKGRSGNPKGRPKGSRNLATDLRRELGETIVIREGERERRVSKQEAMVKTWVAKALKGDPRIAALLVSLCLRLFGPDDPAAADSRELSADDAEVLAALMARIRRQGGTGGGGNGQPGA